MQKACIYVFFLSLVCHIALVIALKERLSSIFSDLVFTFKSCARKNIDDTKYNLALVKGTFSWEERNEDQQTKDEEEKTKTDNRRKLTSREVV